jgi:hypothetical protein
LLVVSSRRYKVAGVSKRLSSIWNVIVNETNSCDFLDLLRYYFVQQHWPTRTLSSSSNTFYSVLFGTFYGVVFTIYTIYVLTAAEAYGLFSSVHSGDAHPYIQVGGDANPLRCREKERYITKKIDGIEHSCYLFLLYFTQFCYFFFQLKNIRIFNF